MTPLERAARALCDEARLAGRALDIAEAKEGVRIALKALREPSESMLDAVAGRFTVEEHFIEADLIVGAENLWAAMIDEALRT